MPRKNRVCTNVKARTGSQQSNADVIKKLEEYTSHRERQEKRPAHKLKENGLCLQRFRVVRLAPRESSLFIAALFLPSRHDRLLRRRLHYRRSAYKHQT